MGLGRRANQVAMKWVVCTLFTLLNYLLNEVLAEYRYMSSTLVWQRSIETQIISIFRTGWPQPCDFPCRECVFFFFYLYAQSIRLEMLDYKNNDLS